MIQRRLPFAARRLIQVSDGNKSAAYAGYWLDMLAGEGGGDPEAPVAILAGDEAAPPSARAVIRLWDFQVGMAGTGVDAAAVSGASAVIGRADGPGLPLPADMPEKWCGAYGLILALAEVWRRLGGAAPATTYDISAADVLRTFCMQNAGGEQETRQRWRRNGKLCVEHGGIFPMGFYRCRDGHVAVLGRSRRDWLKIREALGDPDWAKAPEFADAFAIALDSAAADRHLEATLLQFDRDELLRRGLDHGAVIAPVYEQGEAAARGVFRGDFIDADGAPRLPFVAETLGQGARRESAAGDDAPERPLAGLRCMELAWVWSGPMVGQILGDLGADVVKVEAASRFDLYRTRGVETLRGKMDEAERLESSMCFQSLNRNKRGLTLELKTAAGLDVAKRMLGVSDVLIDNFTVGVIERIGLGLEALAAANPALVHLSMSGPGRGSSAEKLRSYGLVLSALGGAESLVTENGEFLGCPTFSISDPNAAVFGALAALAGALAAREGAGGVSLDLSQIEAAATISGGPALGPEATSAGAPVRELWETEAAPEFAGASNWIPAAARPTGPEMLVAAPWRVEGARPAAWAPAPMLGDGAEILADALGLGPGEIAALAGDGAFR